MMKLLKRLADLWLNFSRGERNGILFLVAVLLLLVSVLTVIPYLPQREIAPEEKEKLLALADSLKHQDNPRPADSLHPFDPNTLPEEAWMRLGLSQRQARTIIRFRNAGGHFNTAQDLFRIYGLDSAWVIRIIPYLQIPQNVQRQNTSLSGMESQKKEFQVPEEKWHQRKEYSRFRGEINSADSVDLVKLYGIGPVMARRIISFRNRLGGFVRMEQLREVYGMRPEMYKVLLESFVCDSSRISKIPLSRTTESELSLHPYLSRWNARSIVKYRQIKGRISSVIELKSEQVLPDSVFRKIVPYLSIE
jgi:DNA uptake protein ComE-like DNA-binding protein